MAPLDFSTGDGVALLGEALNTMGLYSLRDEAWRQWNALPDGPAKQGEFLLWLRGTKEYQAQFPYAEDLRRKGIPFTEAGAVAYNRQARQLLRQAGVPDAWVTQEYVNSLIANDIGFNELQERVAGGITDYMNAPELVKAEFRSQLGDDGAVLGFFLDGQHTMQEFNRIKATALTRGYGATYGFNDIDATAAGEFAYGMTADQIRQRLAQATQFDPLTRGTADDPDALTDTTLVKNVFADDTRLINRELAERSAQFADTAGQNFNQAKTGFGAARGA